MRFGILGPISVMVAGEWIAVPRPLRRAVLGFLLVHSRKVVSSDRLVRALWDDVEPATARAQVHSAVWHLRQALRDGGLDLRLKTLPGGYRLDASDDEVDAGVFAARTAEARAMAGDGRLVEAAERFAAADQLWRGEALGGAVAGYVAHARAKLHEERLAAREDHAGVRLRLGQHTQLIGELTALVAEHPTRQRLTELLMVALHRGGRSAEAAQAYRRLRSQLADESGMDPSRHLQELHASVLRNEPTLDPPRSRAEASGPVRGQVGRSPGGFVGGDERPDEEPEPPSTAEPLPTTLPPEQLPIDPARFVGREAELRRLDRMLDLSQARIAVVAGTAGVGKTALALRWAHRVRGEFPDGQLYVDLRGYASARPVAPLDALMFFLRALGVPAGRTPVDEADAAALYRTLVARRRLLVVLDNAFGSDQVRPLLPGGPGCLALVTSRDRLDGLVVREGATRLGLDVLTPDEAQALLAEILGPERVRAEPRAAAELARLCACLPLALRIAAANLGYGGRGTVADYVAALTAGGPIPTLRIAADHEPAMRTAFDPSYTALTPDARRLFRLMGLIPGPDTTVDAAATLTGDTTVSTRQLLARLVGAHLVQEPVAGRYTSHDLLRRYAADLAAAEDAPVDQATAVARLFTWYRAMTGEAARLVYPERLRLPGGSDRVSTPIEGRVEALAWLDAERSNLVAAVLQAANDERTRPFAWELADALRGYLSIGLHLSDWLAVAHAAWRAAEAAGNVLGHAASRLSLAEAYWRCGDQTEAAGHYTAAAELSRHAGWLAGEAAAVGNLGTVYRQSGRLADAAHHYERALALNRSIGRAEGQAASLGNLGTAYWELGHPERAADHFAEALDLFRSTGSVGGQAIALNNLAEAQRAQGRHAEALANAGRALAMLREIGNRGDEAETLRTMAEIHREAGHTGAALTCAQAAAALAAGAGDRRLESMTLATLGTVHGCLGQPVEALHNHRRALRLARYAANRYPATLALLGLAEAYRALGRPDAAAEHARRALAVARQNGYRFLERRARSEIESGGGLDMA